MGATSPKPENDNSLVDGVSEAEKTREVEFEENPAAGPDSGAGAERDEPPDAGKDLGPEGKPGVDDGPPAPDAIAVEELTTESDDGQG